ncbi:MAG: class I SAM-dependent methyltransferase [Patescibacteria group bacterium]
MEYAEIAEQYEKYGKGVTTDWEIGHKNVAKLLEPIQNKKILDYGCGNGKFSMYLSKFGAKVVGVDVSKSQLEIARKGEDKNIIYFLDNDPKIETEYINYFDAAVLIFVLCEISSKEKIIAVLKRVCKLLKPNGELIILNPNWDKSNGRDFLTHQMQYSSELKPGGKVTTILKGDRPIHIPDYYWSKINYLEMLKEAGFNNFDIHEPLAPKDGRDWKDEKKYPPFLIIKSKKSLF